MIFTKEIKLSLIFIQGRRYWSEPGGLNAQTLLQVLDETSTPAQRRHPSVTRASPVRHT
jgi:hypothetical protein